MYEDMRKDLILEFAKAGIQHETMKQILAIMDIVASNYSIAKMSQEIAVRDCDKMIEAAKLFLVCKQIEGCAEGTVANYQKHIEGFCNYCNRPLDEIDANLIRRYLLLYKTNRNITDASLDHVRQDLSNWFKWMQNEGYIQKNPMVNISKIKFVDVRREALTMTELERLRDACRDDRERCLVEVLYSTGCRISEALNIKVADIKFSLPQPECEVVGKGKKRRVVYFSPRSVSAIQKYVNSRRHDSEYLFVNDRGGGQMKKRNAEKIFSQLRDLANLTDKKLVPHSIRHTTATQLVKIAPVQVVKELLGHAKLDTTLRYAETDREDVKMYHAKVI